MSVMRQKTHDKSIEPDLASYALFKIVCISASGDGEDTSFSSSVGASLLPPGENKLFVGSDSANRLLGAEVALPNCRLLFIKCRGRERGLAPSLDDEGARAVAGMRP